MLHFGLNTSCCAQWKWNLGIKQTRPRNQKLTIALGPTHCTVFWLDTYFVEDYYCFVLLQMLVLCSCGCCAGYWGSKPYEASDGSGRNESLRKYTVWLWNTPGVRCAPGFWSIVSGTTGGQRFTTSRCVVGIFLVKILLVAFEFDYVNLFNRFEISARRFVKKIKLSAIVIHLGEGRHLRYI